MVFKKKYKAKENKEEKQETNYKDLYLRVAADFQNYKRRVEKERSQWIREAHSDVIRPLLSVMDDLERAIESCRKQKESKEQKSILEGLELVYKSVTKTFKDLGVEPIDCSGEFDPDLHEALVSVDSPDHETGQIVDVITKGYTFHSHVIRHAKVSVAK